MIEVIEQVLSVLTVGNFITTISAGLIAGLYLAVFHPAVLRSELVRRSLLQAWYFGFLGSILYGARIVFAAAAHQPDVGRVIGGGLLWLLFSAMLGIGAYIGSVVRSWRQR